MTASSFWPVQQAVYARLVADADLLALLPQGNAAVLDHVPDDTPFPYIVIGDMQARPLETQGTSGHDITLEVLSYSQSTGMKEAKALMAAIYASLHRAAFTVTGHTVILCDLEAEECRLLPDVRTRLGLQRFSIITEPHDE